MDEAEFDKFADEYLSLHARNITVSGEGPEFFAAYKVADAARLLRETGISANAPRILDVGAGIGVSVPHFRHHFPNAEIVCLDVSERSLKLGRERHGQDADFIWFDGSRTTFDDGSFDLVFTACVFHHIDHSEHVGLLTEINRLVAPAGVVVLFEHNPLNPLTVRAVNTCPFDENAHLIRAGKMRDRFRAAGFREIYYHYRIFFPGPLRRFRPLERYLTWLPLGAQYFVVGKK